MKTAPVFAFAVSLILSACSSTQPLSSTHVQDDVFYLADGSAQSDNTNAKPSRSTGNNALDQYLNGSNQPGNTSSGVMNQNGYDRNTDPNYNSSNNYYPTNSWMSPTWRPGMSYLDNFGGISPYGYGNGFGLNYSSWNGLGIGYNSGPFSIYYGSGLGGFSPYSNFFSPFGYSYSPYNYCFSPFNYGYGNPFGYGGYGYGSSYGMNPYYNPFYFGVDKPVNTTYGPRGSVSSGFSNPSNGGGRGGFSSGTPRIPVQNPGNDPNAQINRDPGYSQQSTQPTPPKGGFWRNLWNGMNDGGNSAPVERERSDNGGWGGQGRTRSYDYPSQRGGGGNNGGGGFGGGRGGSGGGGGGGFSRPR